MKGSKLWLALLLASVPFLTGCGPVKIGRLLRDPYRFRDRTVRVEGVVTNSYGVPVLPGFYQVQDDTGKIFVISNGGVPPKGARIKVAGKVTEGVTVRGHSFGTTLRERDHKVKW